MNEWCSTLVAMRITLSEPPSISQVFEMTMQARKYIRSWAVLEQSRFWNLHATTLAGFKQQLVLKLRFHLGLMVLWLLPKEQNRTYWKVVRYWLTIFALSWELPVVFIPANAIIVGHDQICCLRLYSKQKGKERKQTYITEEMLQNDPQKLRNIFEARTFWNGCITPVILQSLSALIPLPYHQGSREVCRDSCSPAPCSLCCHCEGMKWSRLGYSLCINGHSLHLDRKKVTFRHLKCSTFHLEGSPDSPGM